MNRNLKKHVQCPSRFFGNKMPEDNSKGSGSGQTPHPPVTHLSKQLMSGFDKYVPGDDFEEYLELFENFMFLCNVTENANNCLLFYIILGQRRILR